MISLINVEKKYGNELVLRNISIELENTGLYFLLGKSGSGKSTLLNILGGIVGDYSGKIIIDDDDVSKFSEKQWDDFRNSKIGILFQDFNLLEEKSVFENLRLPLLVSESSDSVETLIDDALKKVGMLEFRDKTVCKLSGGQKQRVAMARAILKDQQIILADEPTGNLDGQTSYEVFSVLKQLSKDRLIIVATHDEESAVKFGDVIYRIRDGAISETKTNAFSSKRLTVVPTETKRLSWRDSVRIAFGTAGQKKKRLILLLILMSIVGCCAFLMSNLYKYSNSFALFKYYSADDSPILLATKEYSYSTKVGYEEIYETHSGKDFRENLCKCFGEKNVCGVIEGNYLGEKANEVNFIVANKENCFDCLKINGNIPQKEEEIVLSDFLVQQLGFSTIEVIGKRIALGEAGEFLVTGWFTTDYATILRANGLDGMTDFIESYLDNSCLVSEDYIISEKNTCEFLLLDKSNPVFAQWEYKLLNESALYCSMDTPEEIRLFNGRLPQNSNEIIISKALFDTYNDNTNVNLLGNSFIDFNDERFNKAFSDVINMADFFPEGFNIVGIYESLPNFNLTYPDVLVYPSLFYEIKNVYYNDIIYDRFIALNNEKTNQSTFFYFDEQNITWEDSQAERIYRFSEGLSGANQFFLIMFLSMAVCYLALCMLFLGYSIKDQRRTIGIFRAVGYRIDDVQRIYFVETIMVEFLSLIIICVLYFGMTKYINKVAIADYPQFSVAVFSSDYRRLIAVLFAFVLIGLAAVIVPLYKLSQKKVFELIHYNE